MDPMISPVGTDLPASDQLREQASSEPRQHQGIGAVARDPPREPFGPIHESASARCDQRRDTLRHTTRSLEQYIAEQPLTSVLIAGGVGLLLGRFWMRP
jgi:hypothetical protein